MEGAIIYNNVEKMCDVALAVEDMTFCLSISRLFLSFQKNEPTFLGAGGPRSFPPEGDYVL